MVRGLAFINEENTAKKLSRSPNPRQDLITPPLGPRKVGAAENAGFKTGEILVSMDGVKFSDLKSTTSRLADAPIGEEVTFIVKRAGQEKSIVVRGE